MKKGGEKGTASGVRGTSRSDEKAARRSTGRKLEREDERHGTVGSYSGDERKRSARENYLRSVDLELDNTGTEKQDETREKGEDMGEGRLRGGR